jgi:hypothetical protein
MQFPFFGLFKKLVRTRSTSSSAVNGRPFSHYMHSHRLAAEIWTTMKNTLLARRGGGGDFSCYFYLYRFRKYVSYGFPIINFVIPKYIMKRPVYDKWHLQYNIQLLQLFSLLFFLPLCYKNYVTRFKIFTLQYLSVFMWSIKLHPH